MVGRIGAAFGFSFTSMPQPEEQHGDGRRADYEPGRVGAPVSGLDQTHILSQALRHARHVVAQASAGPIPTTGRLSLRKPSTFPATALVFCPNAHFDIISISSFVRSGAPSLVTLASPTAIHAPTAPLPSGLISTAPLPTGAPE